MVIRLIGPFNSPLVVNLLLLRDIETKFTVIALKVSTKALLILKWGLSPVLGFLLMMRTLNLPPPLLIV